jgi:hypothetical protein
MIYQTSQARSEKNVRVDAARIIDAALLGR